MTTITPSLQQLILNWENAKKTLESVKLTEMDLRKQVVAAMFPDPRVGVNNVDLGRGYTLKYTRSLEYGLDKSDDATHTEEAADLIEALGNEGKFLADRLIKWEPKLSVSEYKALVTTGPNPNPTHVKIKDIIDKVLTIKDGSPKLEVAVPKS